ncbi:hypothetical protein Ahy_A08g040770 [Arachis hypogaea]|uniref:Uncharacterized protein n=1 Tax=Arachis hypogaea TaxID=3818 RepID=A0A445C0L5_ARAHY|nr:hypothetical protein Ahy_A08g040770 [Arachis hypogaea]
MRGGPSATTTTTITIPLLSIPTHALCRCDALPRGQEGKRFVIPTRFLNLLSVFAGLFKEPEELSLLLPRKVVFFNNMVKHLEKDEHTYNKLLLEVFVKWFLTWLLIFS